MHIKRRTILHLDVLEVRDMPGNLLSTVIAGTLGSDSQKISIVKSVPPPPKDNLVLQAFDKTQSTVIPASQTSASIRKTAQSPSEIPTVLPAETTSSLVKDVLSALTNSALDDVLQSSTDQRTASASVVGGNISVPRDSTETTAASVPVVLIPAQSTDAQFTIGTSSTQADDLARILANQQVKLVQQPKVVKWAPPGQPPSGGAYGPVGTNWNGQYVSQTVDINADNDNGSTVTNYIPQYYDFQRTYAQYQNPLLENDLVQLCLSPPDFGDDVATAGFHWYEINITNNGQGRIKVFDSPYKTHELQQGSHQTAYMGLDPFGNPYSLPSFWIEGTHISVTNPGDVTVVVSAEQVINNANVDYDFKPIHVSVTPVMLQNGTNKTDPWFIAGADSRQGVKAAFFGTTTYVPPLYGGVYFMQFVDDFSNDETGGNAVIRDHSLSSLYEKVKNANQMPYPNLKTTLAFLDTANPNDPPTNYLYSFPFEPWHTDGNTSTPTITTDDSPEYIPVDGSDSGVQWKDMKLMDYFTNYIVYAQTERSQLTIYPLYRTYWSVKWYFSGYVEWTGMTDKSAARTNVDLYYEQHAFAGNEAASFNLAADAMEFIAR
jgi:hypothetical protein